MKAITYIKNFNIKYCANAMIDDSFNSSVMRDLVVFNLINKWDNFLFD